MLNLLAEVLQTLNLLDMLRLLVQKLDVTRFPLLSFSVDPLKELGDVRHSDQQKFTHGLRILPRAEIAKKEFDWNM